MFSLKTAAPRRTRFLAAVFAVALLARLLPGPAATRGGLRLLSPDCYAHLRRATSVARNFPRVPVFDPYLNHPDGGVWIWPPAFDFLLGGLARLFFGQEVSIDGASKAAALAPPLLGALQVIPLFFFARRLLGPRRARLAVAGYALLPSAVKWSCFGHADQHVAEALTLLFFLAAASATAAAPAGPARRRPAVVAGLALAGALLTWQGAVFVAGLGLPWGALALGPAAVWMGLATLLPVGIAAALTAAGRTIPFSFVSFGAFQPLLVACLLVPVALLAAARAAMRRARLLCLAVAAALLPVVIPAMPRLVTATFRGGAYLVAGGARAGGDDFANGGYLSYPPDFLRLVAEAQPLLAPLTGPNLLRAIGELSPGFVLLPLAFFFWLRAGRRRALLLLFASAVLLMTLFQRRSAYYLGIFTALALAECVERIFGRATLARRRWALPLVLAAVLLPGLPSLARTAAYVDAPGHDILDLLVRLKAVDPPGVDPASIPSPAPGSVPGVMAPWAAGHFVTALAERPAAADPFVYGWRRQCRLFTSEDDAEAHAILLAARCRYLLTTDLRSVLPLYAAAAGRPPLPVAGMFSVRVHESVERKPVPFLTLLLDSKTYARAPDGRLLPRFRIWRVDDGP